MIRTLEDLELENLDGTAVFLRVDFNVPLENGQVMDGTRLEAALPTLRELQERGARLVLASHCGRPKGEVDPRYSLRPVAAALAELAGQPVAFVATATGEEARRAVAELAPGGLLLLENLRFDPGETANDSAFAAGLAELAEAYVGDAFGTAHRAHASVVGVAERLPRRAAGRLLVREVEALGRLLQEPARPFVAIVGGAKISGKVETVANLLPRLDVLVLGGGMANTFLAARGDDLADSLVESDRLETARQILERSAELGVEVVLPVDLVVADDLDSPKRVEEIAAGQVPAGMKALDVGKRSLRRIADVLSGAATVFWNGPLGVFEKPPFDAGTMAVAAALTECPGFTVVGGGETVAAARRAGVLDRLGHVSTGGGASLELLAGKVLPGVAVLEKAS